MISVGITSETRLTVKDEDTALAWGSGTLPVLATPRMVLMAEQAAMAAGAGELPAGAAGPRRRQVRAVSMVARASARGRCRVVRS